MAAAPTVTFNNGQKCPVLGLGTWLSQNGEAAKSTRYAIEVGYRHIDTAWVYGNEDEVGEGVRQAIKDGLVKREDLFVTTKLWNTCHEREDVVPTLKRSLKNLGFDYIDLYLIHWPVACKNSGHCDPKNPFKDAVYYDHDFCETWKGMEECVDLGLVKSIGLSNFNSKQLERILKIARIKPVTNQIEVNVHLNQKKFIEFCKQRNILITAYSPFGAPARMWKKPEDPYLDMENDSNLLKIAKKYGKSGSQVVLRYLVQLGTIPIPKSVHPDRIKQNIDIFDFELSNDEMKFLDGFDCNFRVVPAVELKESNEYPFRGVEF